MENQLAWSPLQEHLHWKVHVDGTVNQRGSGVGLVIISPKKIIFEKSLRVGFSATNNESKYGALLVGMTMVLWMKGKAVEMFSNSRMVIGQVGGRIGSQRPQNAGIFELG